MALAITFKEITPGLLECDCHIPATLEVYCPESDWAEEDGFVCVACEFCKAGAVRMIDGRELLPIVPRVQKAPVMTFRIYWKYLCDSDVQHIIWSHEEQQRYQVGDQIWCGPCNEYRRVSEVEYFGDKSQ